MFGYPANSMVGKPITMLIPTDKFETNVALKDFLHNLHKGNN